MSKTRIEGLSAINNVLRSLPRATGKAALTRFGKKRLEPMRDTAKAGAPVGEGELRDSIAISTRQGTHGQRKKRFADKAVVEVYMGPDQTQHGHAVAREFGSIKNPPDGYMRKAWDAHNQELLTDLAADLGAAVDGAARRHARKTARRG
ncbi:HK97 gp10 family phage protein [Sphingobium sp. WCS2017Hpa-17]|uniref:HK97 gp10 family phage protein n=1 Tax=Sphingobium sp. WCS2017Hpa-17 TaxID=3073638 RepID=UPI00288A9B17|nr:HK97 gp10 family phage protein [Sphingobium sp. WCS2017Hpa-17]